MTCFVCHKPLPFRAWRVPIIRPLQAWTKSTIDDFEFQPVTESYVEVCDQNEGKVAHDRMAFARSLYERGRIDV